MSSSLTAARITPPSSSASIHTADGWTSRTWLLLVVLCGALFLDGLDISMVGVALPSIGADLGMSAATLQWIVSGYVLGYGGLLLLGGRAADLLGKRSVFLVAVTVFGIASVVSAMLSSPEAIVALRFVKGVAAAFTVPAGLSIITTTFAEGPARNKALSIYTVVGASGFSLGLVFGGVLTELGWRATFLLPGPVSLLLVVVGWRVIPTSARSLTRLADFDLFGAVSSTGALLLFVVAVVEAPTRGWTSAPVLSVFAASAVLAVAFVATELRHPTPLIRLGILRSAHLVHANVAGAIMAGGYFAFQFLVTLYLQNSLGWSPLTMALGFLPAGLLVVASSTRIDRVLARVRTQVLIAVGMGSFLVAYVLFLRVDPELGYAALLLPTMLLLGVGFALTFPSINAQATSGVADHEQGLASGLVNTSVQIGGAVVLAVVSAILVNASASEGPAQVGELMPGMLTGLQVIAVFTAFGVAASVATLFLRAPVQVESDVEAEILA
ncbi:MFS transporter [Nocardioides sp. InS609-2]|uniref:MFS transporter n=1 Tax=Nocardioides sp. InS609-2 TaxID=2760705 RepID=UPI0020BD6E0B|nr:MFS transporter [Nocardioides sp. InS609-2]